MQRFFIFIAFKMTKPLVELWKVKKAMANKLEEVSSKAKEKGVFSSRENFYKG